MSSSVFVDSQFFFTFWTLENLQILRELYHIRALLYLTLYIIQCTWGHEILCTASLNNSLGGVFQCFCGFAFFPHFLDFRKLTNFMATMSYRCLLFLTLHVIQWTQGHEILCTASLNNSLGGVFQRFCGFAIFLRILDLRKLANFTVTSSYGCLLNLT